MQVGPRKASLRGYLNPVTDLRETKQAPVLLQKDTTGAASATEFRPALRAIHFRNLNRENGFRSVQ